MLLPLKFCVFSAKNNQVQRPNILCWTFALKTSVADVICAGKVKFIWLAFLILLPAVIFCLDDASTFKKKRESMVKTQIEARGIGDKRVLAAMRDLPRHLFVPQNLKARAYNDSPLPIGQGQTISQPYIVALMTASLELKNTDIVLEIGTGSGYQAAVLSYLVKEVYTMEIKEALYKQATERLYSLGLANIKTRHGDGYFGWQDDEKLFDCIMITAAINHIPPPLLGQLKVGGRMILPLGNPFSFQNLVLVTRGVKDYTVQNITGVLFVPMTGEALK